MIAGRSGGAPDAVLEGVTGITVDGTKRTEIAAAVVSLFDNPEAAQNMGIAGRKWIESNWRWQIWSDAFSKILTKD